MRMQPDRIGQAIAAYVDAELVSKAVGIQKLALAFAGAGLARQGAALVERYADSLRMIGIVGEDGTIDVDLARDLALEAFEKAGRVHLAGFGFSGADVAIAYEIAKKFSE